MWHLTCTNSNLRVMLQSCVTMDWFLFLYFSFFACFLFMMFCRSRQGKGVLADSHAFYYNCTVYLSYYLLMDSQNVGRNIKHMRKTLLLKKGLPDFAIIINWNWWTHPSSIYFEIYQTFSNESGLVLQIFVHFICSRLWVYIWKNLC